MFCGKCGYKLEDIDKFCPQCGAETQVYRDLMEAAEPAPVNDEIETESLKTDPEPEQETAEPADHAPVSDELETELLKTDPEPEQETAEPAAPTPEPVPERPAENRLEIECVSMSVKPDKNYRVDPNERHELVFLTRDEAVKGCRKVIEVNGAKIAIDVPPNYKAEKAMIIKGYGHMNEETGERGNLKVQFLID